MDSTNPGVTAPMALAANQLISDGSDLDDIEYPSLSDITMKEQSFTSPSTPHDPRRPFPASSSSSSSSSNIPPTIDRSSKLAALKTYNSQRDLLREQNELADKLLASHRECLNEERELDKRIIHEEEKEIEIDRNDDNEPEEDEKINETRFKIMQLDNSIEDAMLKRREVAETTIPIPATSADRDSEEENQRIAASIRQKEEEIRRIQEERERHAAEREEKLRQAKALKEKYYKNKRSQEENKENQSQEPRENHVPKHTPKVPLVDRSVKPTATVIPYVDDNAQRDFAPVYGQVVSFRVHGGKIHVSCNPVSGFCCHRPATATEWNFCSV